MKRDTEAKMSSFVVIPTRDWLIISCRLDTIMKFQTNKDRHYKIKALDVHCAVEAFKNEYIADRGLTYVKVEDTELHDTKMKEIHICFDNGDYDRFLLYQIDNEIFPQA